MAEESAVLKLSGKIYDKFVGPAMCFDDEDDAFEAIVEGRVAKGAVMVIRYEGPKGAPGMPEMLSPGAALVGAGLGKGYNFALAQKLLSYHRHWSTMTMR